MRKIMVIILVSMLVMGLSCGKKDKLTFMHFWTSEEVYPTIKELVAEFEQANPGIEIELIDLNWSGGHDKITTAFFTGTAADIIELGSDWVPEFAAKDLLYDLTSDAGPYKDSLMGWEAATIKGKVYGFPWMLGTRVIFYNKDLMKQVELDPEHPPANWDELYEYSAKINTLGEPVYGFGANSYEKYRLYKKFLPFLWSNGGAVLSPDDICVLTSGKCVAALDFYTKLTDIGYLESQRNLDDKFLAGELGFIISGDWVLRKMKASSPKFEVGACLIPGPNRKGATSASFLGGEFLTINAASDKKEDALKFIRFLVSNEPDLRFNQAAGSVTPSNRLASEEMAAQAGELAKVFLEQLQYARPSPIHPKWVVMQDIIEDAVQQAIYHKGDIAKIMTDACEKINYMLHE
jgi:multiple sugar transport system substrate-binding protein